MKDLSILQKYMVCTVNEKGVFPFASVEERILGLVAAGLLELEMEGCITIRGRKISRWLAGSRRAGRTWNPFMPLSRKCRRSRPMWWWMPITSAGRING